MSIDDVLLFVENFHLDFNPEIINLLSEQFLDYLLLSDHDIPDIQFSRMPVLWMMIEINITKWIFYEAILVK